MLRTVYTSGFLARCRYNLHKGGGYSWLYL